MPQILIVEDDTITALQLQEILTSMGYDVVGTGKSGEEAVQMARKLRPDLILMDIVMPGKPDGIDAAEEISSEMDIPVVFVTGFSRIELLDRAKQMDPHGYILKPFHENQIRVSVEIALHKKDTERGLQKNREELETKVGARAGELDKRTEQLNALLNATTDTAFLIDLEGIVIASNQVTAERFGKEVDEFTGTCIYDLMPPALAKTRKARATRVIRSGKPHRFEDQRQGIVFDSSIYPVFDEKGDVVQLAVYGKDITDRVRSHKLLKEREQELTRKRVNLEEANAALKVLLKKREEDRKELEEKILLNVKEMVEPYLKKMKMDPLSPRQEAYLNVLESNLTDIVSPFLHSLTAKYGRLTPKEIMVANLVKEGTPTKEIALFMNISQRTVERHRESIRRKLGLTNRGANLRSHLLSLH